MNPMLRLSKASYYSGTSLGQVKFIVDEELLKNTKLKWFWMGPTFSGAVNAISTGKNRSALEGVSG